MPLYLPNNTSWELDDGAFLDSGLFLDTFEYFIGDGLVQEYSIAKGWNITLGNLTNLETIFPSPPRIETRPLQGNNEVITLSGVRIYEGEKFIRLTYNAAYYTDLTEYVNLVFTDGWNTTTSSQKVTVRVRNADNNFKTFNGFAHLPKEGTHYTHYDNDTLQSITLDFTLIT